MVEIKREVIRAYALENALKYEGKANTGSVLSALFSEGLDKSEITNYIPLIQEVVNEVNSLDSEKQKIELDNSGIQISKREVREGLPELTNAIKGKVVTRFAPFPSGPLHLGNARPLILNDEYVKIYGGEFILAMDDTIGSIEKPIEPEAYALIEEGARWLGADFGKHIFYKSDRIERYYEYAEELLKGGYMYVCTCSKEKLQENRAAGIACPCRSNTSDDNLKKWGEMFTAPEGSMSARLKTNMNDPDPAFRDRVMFRISDRDHPRRGKKYRVYPLLEFSWAVDDHRMGITHIIRGMELEMETRVEKFIWDIFKWTYPEVIYNGHFTPEGVKFSKSKSSKEVRDGTFTGWNDPRTWSLQSLRDRGILPESVREFILSMGMKRTSIVVPIDVLYTINRKKLDHVPRYFFVEDPVSIRVKGAPELKPEIPFHASGERGSRSYKTGQEFLISVKDYNSMKEGNYRLMHLLNFKADNIQRIVPTDFSFISEHPDSSLNPTFIQWLPANDKNFKVDVLMPEGSIVSGLGEPEMKRLKEGDIVQFERFGYVRLHKKQKNKLEFWYAHK